MQNQQQILIETQFEGLTLYIRPHETHEWLMETKLVAEGYEVSEEVIRNHKSRNSDELVDNKHFVTICYEKNYSGRNPTFWTKRGVIRLGFFIKSARAKLFRDWAEDLIIRELEKKEKYVTEERLAEALTENNRMMQAQTLQYLDAIYRQFDKRLENMEELIHNLSLRVDKLEKIMLQPHELGERKAYVYLLRKIGTNEYKIGKSIDPSNRTKKFTIGGANLDLIASKMFPSESLALTWETLFHKLFHKKHIKGEWFLLDQQDVAVIRQLFTFLENIY